MSVMYKLLPPPEGDNTKELLFQCQEEGCGAEVKSDYLVNHARTAHGTGQFSVDTIPRWSK